MDRPLFVTTLAALALHVGSYAILRVPPERAAVAPVAPQEQEMVVVLDELRAPPSPESGSTSATPRPTPDPAAPRPAGNAAAPLRTPGVLAMIGKAASSGGLVGEEGGASPEAPTPSSEPAKPAGGKPFPSLIDLSSPGKHSFILPSPKPSVSPVVAAQKKLDAQLSGAVDAKDQEKGLGSGGPVASAAHDVSSGVDAPETGSATIDVETDASGMVTEAHLVEATDHLAWSKVAGKLKKRLAATPLKVPSGAGGVTVRVKITAAMKLPSGAPSGKAVTAAPMGLGVGGTFDVADIGQKPRRMVGVIILRETRK